MFFFPPFFFVSLGTWQEGCSLAGWVSAETAPCPGGAGSAITARQGTVTCSACVQVGNALLFSG